MKTFFTILISTITISLNAQTATNFTCNDCNGVSHDLFTELDNGNVIVLCWVMPCGSCVSGALTCNNITATYPANVKYYVADDEANTSCTSVSGWLNGYGIQPDAVFSDASIDMLDYGSSGMPKVVVIGGAGHTVFYNANNSFNPTDIQNAINQALVVAAVPENEVNLAKPSVFPNPARTNAKVSFTSISSEEVMVEIYNNQGQIVQTNCFGSSQGKNEYDLDVSSLADGCYSVRIKNDSQSMVSRLVVSH